MVKPCVWFKEEPSQFPMGQTAQSLTCSIMEKPHTRLDKCPRILIARFRARNSVRVSAPLFFHVAECINKRAYRAESFGRLTMMEPFAARRRASEERPPSHAKCSRCRKVVKSRSKQKFHQEERGNVLLLFHLYHRVPIRGVMILAPKLAPESDFQNQFR